MIALARVHALFTHLEEDIRKSELVPGPYKHYWSRELPAFELVPREMLDNGKDDRKTSAQLAKPGWRLRVVARKRTDAPRWLIAAWAAFGDASEVTVNLPEYGMLKLFARPAGSVYVLDTRKTENQLTLIDKDPLLPSQSAATLLQ